MALASRNTAHTEVYKLFGCWGPLGINSTSYGLRLAIWPDLGQAAGDVGQRQELRGGVGGGVGLKPLPSRQGPQDSIWVVSELPPKPSSIEVLGHMGVCPSL